MDDAHARDADATVELPDAYRLLEVLEAVARAGGRGGRVPMCAVTLDQPLLVGAGALVWRASPDGQLQRGLAPREFLTIYRGRAPRLAPATPAWVFDEFASPRRGPDPIRGPDQAARIAATLREASAAQAQIAAALAARRAAQPDAAPWTTCPVCNGIAAYSFARWQAGELPTDADLVADRYLEILGAPHFNDSVGSRDWCIKRCGVCATHYHWQGDYEYLAGGTEDSITITRLADADLPGWLAQVEARVRAATGAG